MQQEINKRIDELIDSTKNYLRKGLDMLAFMDYSALLELNRLNRDYFGKDRIEEIENITLGYMENTLDIGTWQRVVGYIKEWANEVRKRI